MFANLIDISTYHSTTILDSTEVKYECELKGLVDLN